MSEEIVYHDVIRWAEENIRVSTFYEESAPIKLYTRQKEILTSWNSNKINILVASRQVGTTTMILIDAIYHALNFSGCSICIVSTKEAISDYNIERIIDIANLKEILCHKTKNRIAFLNGSEIIFFEYYTRGVCGRSLNRIYLMDYDYASYISHKDVLSAIMPLISSKASNSSIVIASCPNPKMDDNDYGILRLYENSVEGKYHYNYTVEKFFWNQVPDRDEKWKERMLQGLGADKEEIFKYEFNCGE
jgi:hypothetical protein